MDYLPPLPVAVPLLAAALLMAASSVLPRRPRDLLAVAAAVAVAILCGLLLAQSLGGPVVYWFGGWRPRAGVALGIGFVIDPLGAGLALLAAVLVTAGLVFSWRFFDEVGALYPALMLVFLGAMAGFCLTGDLFNLFVFFELMSVSAYALTAYKIEEEQALMGAFNFAITNSVGAFLVLTGIGLHYGRTGALNLAQLGRSLANGPADRGLRVAAGAPRSYLPVVAPALARSRAISASSRFTLASSNSLSDAVACLRRSATCCSMSLNTRTIFSCTATRSLSVSHSSSSALSTRRSACCTVSREASPFFCISFTRSASPRTAARRSLSRVRSRGSFSVRSPGPLSLRSSARTTTPARRAQTASNPRAVRFRLRSDMVWRPLC
jgi:hypothetical protein